MQQKVVDRVGSGFTESMYSNPKKRSLRGENPFYVNSTSTSQVQINDHDLFQGVIHHFKILLQSRVLL